MFVSSLNATNEKLLETSDICSDIDERRVGSERPGHAPGGYDADADSSSSSDSGSLCGGESPPSSCEGDIPSNVASSVAPVPCQMLPRGVGDTTGLEQQLGALLDREELGVDIHMSAFIGRVQSSSSPGELESAACALFHRRIAQGDLERLSDDIYRRVHPVPVHGHLPRRSKRGYMRRNGDTGARVDEVRGIHVKDTRKLRDGVGDKEKLEEKFSKFFQDLVSTWNPCFLNDGRSRFDWDARVEAHDVEVDIDCGTDYLPKEGDGLHRWPERVRLSKVLAETFRSNCGTFDREQVDVQPLRRLVAALVQCSARHDLHGKDRLVIGVHVCARGKPGCANCRFGCPIKVLRLRLGGCDCILVKEDREGWWRLRTPRNDELCCLYEGRVLLANFGNIDWRPCLNLWAVVQYISKYATKAPKGSCRMFFGNRAARRCKKAARRRHLRWLGYQTGFGSRLVSLSRKRR